MKPKTITVKKREVHKPLLITAITIGAILLLSLFLIFQEVLVGKAITFGPLASVSEGSAGIFAVSGEEDVGATLTVPIVANVGTAQSVALRFQLVIPDELSLYAGMQNIACNNVAANSALAEAVFTELDDLFMITSGEDSTLTAEQDLRVLRQLSCETIGGNDVLTAEYAALCVPEVGTGDCEQSITGAMEITRLPLRVLSAPADGTAELLFYPLNNPTIEILNVDDNNNLISDVQAGQLSIAVPEVCAPAALDLCTTSEECLIVEGGIWDAASSSCSIPEPCSVTNSAACDTLAECESINGEWEAFTGTCTIVEGEVPPVEGCSEDNPSACTTEALCTGISGVFAAGACTLPPPPPVGPEIIFAPTSVIDVPSDNANIFTTRITAPAAIASPFQVFTMLFDAENVRLLLEARRIESMTAGQQLDITVDASGTGRTAVRKEVIIYDTPDPAVWKVHTAQKIVHTRTSASS